LRINKIIKLLFVLKKIFIAYRHVEPAVLNLILAEFCLQFINGAFFLLLNLYMTKCGYTDVQIANYVSWRYAAVVLFAVPFGMYLRNRRILPVMWASAVALPVLSLILLECIDHHFTAGIVTVAILWGVVFNLVGIPIIPYILRNAAPETRSEAIALHAATWSSSQIIAGLGIAVLSSTLPAIFTDKVLLQLFSVLGLGALFFLSRIKIVEKLPETNINETKIAQINSYDWDLIAKASIPTLLVATGAGLAIPFMNLFFYNTFGLDSAHFALLGMVTSFLVSFSVLFTPYIKNRLGYNAIIITQLASITTLVLMGVADYYSGFGLALWAAILCYMFRQPLMNLANPLTSEMTMYYVGKNNRELISAIGSSIWSGSWFFSSQIFAWLRGMNLRYGAVFFITSGMYLVAVLVYVFLISDYKRREQAGLIEI
jgi:hypothetical protein